MAALESIRKRAVLLTVIIGVALLAFILGDLLNSGQAFFGDGNTIVKVGDEKIDAMELQKNYEEVSALYQQRGVQIEDGAVLQNRLIEGMIDEKLLNNEFNEVGIYVTDNELTEAMIGVNAHENMYNFAAQYQLTPAQLYELITTPAKFGATPDQVAPIKQQWLQLEKSMLIELKRQKMEKLLAGLFQANELDKKALFEENAVTSEIAYVKSEYSALNDEEYKATEAELKAEYEKQKKFYALDEETRKGLVIAVDVVPSADDLAQAKALIDTTLAVLRANEGVNDIRSNRELVVEEGTVQLKDIRNTTFKTFVEKAKVGDVSDADFTQNVYTIVKLNGKKMEIDSINYDEVQVMGDAKLQDSILTALNNGADVNELVKNNAQKMAVEANQSKVVTAWTDSIKDKLFNAGKKYFVLASNDQGAAIVKVNKKAAPKQMYDVAFVTYRVVPSTNTVNNLRDNLQAFINTNNRADSLEQNAVMAGYQPRVFAVTSSTPQVNGISNTRKAVQWLFGANEGDVSPIYDKENNDKMVVVALTDIYDEGFVPMSDPTVSSSITPAAIAAKKGAALVEKFNGKANDLEGYAQLMNAKIDTAYVTYGQYGIPVLGKENALMGSVYAANENEVSKVVKGENGVYVFKVVKNERTTREPGAEVERSFNTSRGFNAVKQRMEGILRNSTTIENEMIKFF